MQSAKDGEAGFGDTCTRSYDVSNKQHRLFSQRILLGLCGVLLATVGGLTAAIIVMKTNETISTKESITKNESPLSSFTEESTIATSASSLPTVRYTTVDQDHQTLTQTEVPKNSCEEYPCLIFEDNFDDLNMDVWEHEITASGGGNWEFEYYINNRSNSYVRDGKLYIKPTLTAHRFSEDFIETQSIDLKGIAANDICTGGINWGCERSGNRAERRIINPIQSAKLRSVRGFNIKYGKLEIVAKIPSGDWIWPAIWMLPRWLRYGSWPASGEIDIMESRGNVNMTDSNGNYIGNNYVGSTLHYGPDPDHNGFPLAMGHTVRSQGTFADRFFTYVLEWTPEGIRTTLDGEEILNVRPGPDGFWRRGEFSDNLENPWRNAHTKMAPFDQEFYLIFNVAVGGVGAYFPEVPGKPWSNTSPNAAWDFWAARDQWYPTWKPDVDNGEGAALVIDSVRYWKLQA